jgi:hypothetical protein
VNREKVETEKPKRNAQNANHSTIPTELVIRNRKRNWLIAAQCIANLKSKPPLRALFCRIVECGERMPEKKR